MATIFYVGPDASQADTNSRAAIPPFAFPLPINDFGEAFVPHAFYPALTILLPVQHGIAAGWTPSAEVGGVLLTLFAGNVQDATDEAFATKLSQAGLRAFIAGLQSIADQLEQADG